MTFRSRTRLSISMACHHLTGVVQGLLGNLHPSQHTGHLFHAFISLQGCHRGPGAPSVDPLGDFEMVRPKLSDLGQVGDAVNLMKTG